MFQTSVFKNMPVKKKNKKSKTSNSHEDDLHSKLKRGSKLEGLNDADIAIIEEEVQDIEYPNISYWKSYLRTRCFCLRKRGDPLIRLR